MGTEEKTYNVVLRDRIAKLELEMATFCKELELEKPPTVKTIAVSLYFECSLLGKIKSAIMEGHLKSISDITQPMYGVIEKIEKEHGELPYVDPAMNMTRAGKRGLGSIKSKINTALKRFQKQIVTLKEELKENDER